jgi:hypothetical protein
MMGVQPVKNAPVMIGGRECSCRRRGQTRENPASETKNQLTVSTGFRKEKQKGSKMRSDTFERNLLKHESQHRSIEAAGGRVWRKR